MSACHRHCERWLERRYRSGISQTSNLNAAAEAEAVTSRNVEAGVVVGRQTSED